MNKINLMITCPRGKEESVASNIYFALRSDLKDEKCDCKISSFPGIVYAYTTIATDVVISFLKDKLNENKWYLGVFAKMTPIHKIVKLEEYEIINSAIKLSKLIAETNSFKIHINNRNKVLNSNFLIEEIASKINNKVDLENPDKIIQIEVLEDFCGISLLDEKLIVKSFFH